MPRLSFFLLLAWLAPLQAFAAAPELVCDPDARVIFQSHWLTYSTVELSADLHWQLPWTGHEAVTLGQQFRERPDVPDELKSIPETSEFLTYRPISAGSPVETLLYVERELLSAQEQDGLVIAELIVAGQIDAPTTVSKFRVYHCRSR
ncbi:MAG: hypothetical protein ACXVB9_15315 [Bdellovibrionota bacterium]